MGLYSYDPGARYRQRAAKRVSNICLFILFLGAVLLLGFWVGGIKSQQNIYILGEENTRISEEVISLQEEITALRADAQTANVRYEQLKTSLDELLSDGDMSELVELIRKQLDKGVDISRLESIILSARPPQNCSDADSKRFVIMTPVYSGANSFASIGNGAIKVFGKGVSAKNNSGNNEAWFDPTKPVEIIFQDRDGQEKVKSGVLPLYNSMIVGDKEYRFTVSVGAKSFAKVTFDHCDYP